VGQGKVFLDELRTLGWGLKANTNKKELGIKNKENRHENVTAFLKS
jgi:hypothetical protein